MTNANWEFPIRYTIHKTGNPDIILMLGRDLRPIAEFAASPRQGAAGARKGLRDPPGLRDALSRGDGGDQGRLRAGRSGQRADPRPQHRRRGGCFGDDPDVLTGSPFRPGIRRAAPRRVHRRSGSLPPATRLLGQVTAQARRSGSTRSRWNPSCFRAAGDKVLLCRIDTSETAETVAADLTRTLSHVYREGPDAMVFTDVHGADPAPRTTPFSA